MALSNTKNFAPFLLGGIGLLLVTAAMRGGGQFKPIESRPEEGGKIKALPDDNPNRPLPDKHVVKLKPLPPLPDPTTDRESAVAYALTLNEPSSTSDKVFQIFRMMYPNIKPVYGTDTQRATDITKELIEIEVELERQIQEALARAENVPSDNPIENIINSGPKVLQPFEWPNIFNNPAAKDVMLAYDHQTQVMAVGSKWFEQVLTPWLNQRWEDSTRTENYFKIRGLVSGPMIGVPTGIFTDTWIRVTVKGFGFTMEWGGWTALAERLTPTATPGTGSTTLTIKVDYDDPKFEKVVAELFTFPFVAVRGTPGLTPLNTLPQTQAVKKLKEEIYKFIKRYVIKMVDARAFVTIWKHPTVKFDVDYDSRDVDWDAVNNYAATKF